MNTIFLHGLDSSGFGTKGRYFSKRFPDMQRPDFDGTLSERLVRLEAILQDSRDIIIVGSSFGGLMGACFAINHPGQVKRLIMLAPALNFQEFHPPKEKIAVESLLMIGKDDTVTPPGAVIPVAEATFSDLKIMVVPDDHLLHNSYQDLDWPSLLS